MAGAVPSANKIMLQFVEFYDANKNFRESLVVSLENTSVWNLTSIHNNSRNEEIFTGFIRVLGTYNKSCASIDSANLGGPSYRNVKILNSKDQVTWIIQSGFDDVVGRILQAIQAKSNPGTDGVVAFLLQLMQKKYRPALK